MKKMLATMLALLPLYAVAQNAEPVLEGLGKFKVGKTTLAIIPDLEVELKTKVKQAKTYTDYFRARYNTKGNTLLEIINDSTSYNGPPNASQCTSAKIYYLPKYTISGIEIAEMKLTFFGGVLVELECDGNTELDDALKSKYGAGKEENTEKEVPCTFTYTGNKVVYKESKFENNWDSPLIKASLVLRKYYDDKCKEHYLHYVLIADRVGSKAHDKCWHDSVERRQAAKQAETKKKASDL